ncbi:MAG TPA: glycosyltransferase [Candidatus Thermoplasmatota archaeon]|nr:glycosyltransferase [Candidatus Thermoplasmatota archaeon]
MPRLSVVVLTLNEAHSIAATLASLARQDERDIEVIVVDAASTDGTAAKVRSLQDALPFPVRLYEAATCIPIGQARNLGVAMAQAPNVAFLSADAELEPTWVREALASLAYGDMAFGYQVHAPHRWTMAAAVRSLRYHYPRGVAQDPILYASNVAAAYRREVLVEHPFDAWANAAEDLLLAKRAAAAGHTAVYNPRMVVRHHDVDTVRGETRKNRREGQGWAVYRHELGVQKAVLAWGIALVACLLLVPFAPRLGLALLGAALWLPTLRRAVRRRRDIPWRPLLLGVAASPAFDVTYLVHYVRGLVGRPFPSPPTPEAQE